METLGSLQRRYNLMKQTKHIQQTLGWILFLLAIGFFGMQLAYFYGYERFQVEYIDDRLFYMINIMFIVSLFFANLLLFKRRKKYQLIGAGLVVLFIVVHVMLLMGGQNKINNITSISPNFKHVLSIKENVESGEATYYRSYYGILGRPKEPLPTEISGDMQVEWLADDVAAVTYQAPDQKLQQFIATYGDRGGGTSYYYVGAEIHGRWQGDHVEVISDEEGITVKENNQVEQYPWDNIEQFGTLAVVLMDNNEAAWTISLNENFEVHSGAPQPTVGNISLYKATMDENDPIILDYKDSE